MSQNKKHVGRIKSTEQRCVVVFMQLPDDKNKALIINIESLTERMESLLMEVLNSAEGQQANDLASTMNRRLVPETGRTVLEEFHVRGMMRAESIDNIQMLPRPNMPFELRDILKQLGAINGDAPDAPNSDAEVKYNQFTENAAAQDSENAINMAKGLLMEADMLGQEAQKKREQAYGFAPSLRPKTAE